MYGTLTIIEWNTVLASATRRWEDFENSDRKKTRIEMTQSTKTQPPPIGVMPQQLWKEQRLQEPHAAIKRYIEAENAVPLEWLWEAYELDRELK